MGVGTLYCLLPTAYFLLAYLPTSSGLILNIVAQCVTRRPVHGKGRRMVAIGSPPHRAGAMRHSRTKGVDDS